MIGCCLPKTTKGYKLGIWVRRSMELMEILAHIPIELNPTSVHNKLKSHDRGVVEGLITRALSLAQARAVFAIAYVEARDEDAVVIEGRRFKSRVLRKNLDDVGRVFPAVVTLGGRFDEAVEATVDLLEKYYLDAIGNLALAEARAHLITHLCQRFAIDKLSWMSPGSLADWPLEEQQPLFELLGGVEAAIGVRLTDSLLMLPRKSVSGIFFPAESTFFSCRLCPRDRCDNRKARYDEASAHEYGILK
jgi:hypothetical protein